MNKDFSTFNKKEQLESIFNYQIATHTNFIEKDIDFLVDLVNVFRPHNVNIVYDIDLSPLINILKENHQYTVFLEKYLNEIFKEKDFDQLISDTGIIKDTDFFYEMRKRLIEKILPHQPEKNTLEYILNQVFFSSSDPIWIKRIPKSQIDELTKMVNFNSIYSIQKDNFPLSEIIYGLEILIQRICGRALETDVSKMIPEYQNLDSPFIALQRELSEFNDRLINEPKKFISSNDQNYKQILILHKQCQDYLKHALKNSNKYGISLKVNQSLLRIKQQLIRVEETLYFLILDSEEDKKRKSQELAFLLINYNCTKNNLKKLFNESTQLLSYEITQHTAITGENYITNNQKEYFKMFRTAAGGGFIVAFLCIFKVLLSKIEISGFGHAFLYSMNYSLGFIAIYLLGFTLATKQPAMTATALVRALEQGSKSSNIPENERYKSFAVFFARVFRSQFIAFVGNVIMAFPVAMLLIWLIDITFNYNIAQTKWTILLNDLNPFASHLIFHSAIAGVFLFISGIITGSISNRNKHYRIYYRIQEHPLLKRTFGKKKTEKISKIYEKKGAGIISNFWFGIFMGSTSSIGIFLGLDLDIRHITFASGNLALGIYGNNFDIPTSMIIWGIFGVGLIGLINFLVSFTISLMLALRSRNFKIIELRAIALSIWKFFKQRPSSFFFPPKVQK